MTKANSDLRSRAYAWGLEGCEFDTILSAMASLFVSILNCRRLVALKTHEVT